MSAEDQIKQAIGDLKSPSINPLGQSQPITGYKVGSNEDKIAALETDVATLRDALMLAGRQIDDLAAKVITTEQSL